MSLGLLVEEVLLRSAASFEVAFTSWEDSSLSYAAVSCALMMSFVAIRKKWAVSYRPDTKIWEIFLPRSLSAGASFFRDLQVFFMGRPLHALWSILIVDMGAASYRDQGEALTIKVLQWLFQGWQPQMTNGIQIDLLYSILTLITYDFGTYVAHRFMHEIPALWQFHKFHHSATELSGWTRYRHHPVDLTIFGISHGLCLGLMGGIIHYFTGLVPSVLTLSGFAVLQVIFNMGAVLQHSHIWWSFGKLDYVFNSPAQHIIHHSKNPQHHGKNLASFFSIFDLLFGTFHKATASPALDEVGLSEGEDWNGKSLFWMYANPFLRALQISRRAHNSGSVERSVHLCNRASPSGCDEIIRSH